MITKNNFLNEVYKLILLIGYSFLFIYKKARKTYRKIQKKLHLTGTKRKIIAGCLLVIFIIFTSLIIVKPANADAKTVSEGLETISYKYFQKYYVKSGDTLWDIAEEYRYEETITEYIEDVCRINHLKFDNIVEGQMIIIPFYSSELL